MKAIHFFARMFGLAILCLSATITKAQVQQLAGFHTTGTEYEQAAISTFEDVTVVAYQKPDKNIRLISYVVSTTGKVTEQGGINADKANDVNVLMLNKNKVILVRNTTGGKQSVSLYARTNGGSWVFNNTWNGPSIKNYKPGVARLSDDSFATGVALSSGALRVTTFKTAIGGNFPSTEYLVKKADSDHGGVFNIKLLTLSANRIVAGVQLGDNQAKLICFDLGNNLSITRRGDQVLSGTIKSMCMAKMSASNLSTWNIDGSNRLDATTFKVNSSGNFIQTDYDNDIPIPGTVPTQFYQLKAIDGHYVGNGKMLLCGLLTSDKLSVIPFKINSEGKMHVESGAFTSSDKCNRTFAARIGDGKLIAASRLMTNKYRVAVFKW
ncbi:MAG: hypothetical protein AAB316_02670 [Bacteroidota bacterium]